MDAVASNLANLQVNGYKRRATASQSFDVMLAGRLERAVKTETSIDFSQGTLQSSDNPYDLALSGPGFFAVETKQGERYTRNGQFHIDDQGTLLSLTGHPVAWQGARGTIDPQGPEIRVDPEGFAWQGAEKIGQIKVTNFAKPERLIVEGDGLFRSAVGAKTAPPQGDVLQHRIENANVSAVDEMVEMISLQRGFDFATRLMSAIDGTYRRLTAQR